jgi:hypothetical protein
MYVAEFGWERRRCLYAWDISGGHVESLELQVVEISLQVPKPQVVRRIQCMREGQRWIIVPQPVHPALSDGRFNAR